MKAGIKTDTNMNKVIMLGTGHATVTKCYNTCFIVKSAEDMLLVDAGGGNGILRQLEAASIDIADIHNLFVTHAHTDHILGVIWVIRMVMQQNLRKTERQKEDFKKRFME